MSGNSSDGFDLETMLKPSPANTPQVFIVGGLNLSRGSEYLNESINTLSKYTTISLKCWQIVDAYLRPLPDNAIGTLYDSESYLIKWTFSVEYYDSNNKLLNDEKHQTVLYFHWRGENAANGYSPLPEDEVKTGNSPLVVRVVQLSEPPVFLRIFSGKLIIRRGRTSDPYVYPRLYILRGEFEEELHLIEVPCVLQSLRSRTSFVLCDKNRITIWNGCKSKHLQLIRSIVHKLFTNAVYEIQEFNEGQESEYFFDMVYGKRVDYFSLLDSQRNDYNYVPKLFYFNDITGRLSATEIENPSAGGEIFTPFPFLQSHLYTATQPALFLLDDNEKIWLWKGWQSLENVPSLHFNEQFESIKVVARNYAKAKGKSGISIELVHAGLEPLAFTNLFPIWQSRPDVTEEQIDINGLGKN